MKRKADILNYMNYMHFKSREAVKQSKGELLLES